MGTSMKYLVLGILIFLSINTSAQSVTIPSGKVVTVEELRQRVANGSDGDEAGWLCVMYVSGIDYQKNSFPQNYSEALHYCQVDSEKGKNATVQAIYAEMFENGQGTTIDNDKAFQWFMKSAQGGSRRGLAGVGRAYYYGKSVKVDLTRAFEYLVPAALQGDPGAQLLLGGQRAKIVSKLPGHTQDIPCAKYWLERSARQGKIQAMQELGELLAKAEPTDYEQAYFWLARARSSKYGFVGEPKLFQAILDEVAPRLPPDVRRKIEIDALTKDVQIEPLDIASTEQAQRCAKILSDSAKQ